MRRRGGRVGGGCWRGGSWARRRADASATLATASSNAASVRGDVVCTPLTLRTYWRAAASISSLVASGSRPRRVVMFRHMAARLVAPVEQDVAVDERDRQPVWTPSGTTNFQLKRASAFVWVIISTSSSGTPSKTSLAAAWDLGQGVSAWGSRTPA